MIIQNTAPTNVVPQVDIQVRETAPKIVANTSTQIALQQPSPEQLKNAVDIINQVMQQSNHSLEFSVDNETHITVVKMVDTSTGELIRQFPSEQTLAISRDIDKFQQGLLLKHKA